MGFAILRSLALALMAGSAVVLPSSTAQPVVADAAAVAVDAQQSVTLDPAAISSGFGDPSAVGADPGTIVEKALAKTQTVAIVGAGMAGFSAARYLSSQGYQVVVLEARDRIGGRVWTDSTTFGDVKIERGAGWIHGPTTANPLVPLASSVGAKITMVAADSGTMFNSAGKELSDAAQATAETQVETALDWASTQAEAKDTDSSLGTLVDQWVAKQSALTTNAAAREAFYLALDSEVVQEYADDVSKMSAWYWDNDLAFSERDGVLAGGYDQLFKGFTTLKGVSVRLNTVVKNIQYSCTGRVTITTTANQNIAADRVIVTVPLGQLKANAIAFSPALPSTYTQAVARLGFGTLDKVILRYNSVFWENLDWLTTVATLPSGAKINTEFFNMAPYIGKPILVFFTAGSTARNFETLSDAQQVKVAVDQLRRMYPGLALATTTPVKYAVTRWSQDPYSRGSYSYYAKGSTPADRKTLRTPVCNRVFFAGEHTNANYFATVHGAYSSGLDTAKLVIAS